MTLEAIKKKVLPSLLVQESGITQENLLINY